MKTTSARKLRNPKLRHLIFVPCCLFSLYSKGEDFRSNLFNVNFELGSNQFLSTGFESAWAIGQPTVLLIDGNYTRFSPGVNSKEMRLGLDWNQSQILSLRGLLNIRYGPYNHLSVGENIDSEWKLNRLWKAEKETTAELGIGWVRNWKPISGDFFREDLNLIQLSGTIGFTQAIFPLLSAGVSYTHFDYNYDLNVSAEALDILSIRFPTFSRVALTFPEYSLTVRIVNEWSEKWGTEWTASSTRSILTKLTSVVLGGSLLYSPSEVWLLRLSYTQSHYEEEFQDYSVSLGLSYVWD